MIIHYTGRIKVLNTIKQVLGDPSEPEFASFEEASKFIGFEIKEGGRYRRIKNSGKKATFELPKRLLTKWALIYLKACELMFDDIEECRSDDSDEFWFYNWEFNRFLLSTVIEHCADAFDPLLIAMLEKKLRPSELHDKEADDYITYDLNKKRWTYGASGNTAEFTDRQLIKQRLDQLSA